MVESSETEAAATVVVWEPQPGPQTALVNCPVFEVFYGGARGGGKTDGVLGEFALHAFQYGKHASGLMVRRTRTELVDTIERSKEIYAPIGATFNEQSKLWRFPNGARLLFAYLENDSDAENYQGHNYTRVYVEEITNFPKPEPIFKLMATLRSGHGVPCCFRATGNPGGAGHHWVKARYGLGKHGEHPNGWEIITETFRNPWTDEISYKERIFIPAKVSDNQKIGADYVANIQLSGSGSPELVRAWLEGDWDIVAGAYFPEIGQQHFISRFEIPDHWMKFGCMDWGTAAPSCFLWMAVSDGEEVRWEEGDVTITAEFPKGAIIVYREMYLCDEMFRGLKLPASEQARQIRLRQPEKEKLLYSRADPSMFKQDGGPSHAEEMAQAGVILSRGDNNRTNGWAQCRKRFRGINGKPMVYIMKHCVHLIRTLPALQHDPNNMEDVDTEGEDHAGDAFRYGLMSRPWAIEQKKVEPTRSPEKSTMNEALQAHFKARKRLRLGH